ncbi:hypothetical protein, partial [Hallella sp.]|uniref:hypothetical protein n=1 Tax=Hallella sp. TaxID=2980186 RepID=UPI003079073C
GLCDILKEGVNFDTPPFWLLIPIAPQRTDSSMRINVITGYAKRTAHKPDCKNKHRQGAKRVSRRLKLPPISAYKRFGKKIITIF